MRPRVIHSTYVRQLWKILTFHDHALRRHPLEFTVRRAAPYHLRFTTLILKNVYLFPRL